MLDQNHILLRFDNLQVKLQNIVSQLAENKVKLKLLEEENILLKSSLKQKDQNIKSLQKNAENQQKNFLKRDFLPKLVNNNMGIEGNTAELKKTLDEYIKEIDDCIAKLSN